MPVFSDGKNYRSELGQQETGIKDTDRAKTSVLARCSALAR